MVSRTRSRQLALALLAFFATLALFAGGCTVTPMPEPPNLDPPDVTKLTFGTSSGTGQVMLMGDRGALGAGERLWAVNLDGVGPPIETVAADDGGFTLGLSSSFGDELRLQARLDAQRSDPVDVEVPSAAPVVRPFADCLTARPLYEVGFRESPVGSPVAATLRLDNACGVTIELAAPRLRVERADFVVTSAMPTSIADGATVEIALSWTPRAAGLAEEILFIDVIAPESSRWPFTLWGTSPE